MKKTGIYIHIPFCKSKCIYCDFCSFVSEEETYKLYKDALISEIKSTDLTGYEIETIFIGGGTPTALPPSYLREILEALHENFKIENTAEITVEANPGTLNREMLKLLKQASVNRLSIGLQSADNRILKAIGRIHSYEEFYENFILAREYGFNNINADIMFSLPLQTPVILEDTLNKIVSLSPEHISAYSLTIEETHKNILPDINENEDREMYESIKRTLKENNYTHYEISNFAKQNYESRHNILYWELENYRGFGLNAHSFFENKRFNNTADMDFYIKNAGNHNEIIQNIIKIEKKEAMEEFMFLGLRMLKGISLQAFMQKFGISMLEIYEKPITKYVDYNLLVLEKGHLKLTDKGLDVCNTLFTEFLL